MSLQIQFRIWTDIPDYERAIVGEPFYDPIRRRFGVFPNVDSKHIDWFPRFTSLGYGIEAGQYLHGLLSEDQYNHVALDWSVEGQLRIVDTTDGTVIATFSKEGTGLLSPSSTADISQGISNLAINGNLSVLDPLTPSGPILSVLNTYRAYPYQPGWLLWSHKTDVAGSFTVETITAPAGFEGAKNCFRIRATAAYRQGLRQTIDYRSVEGKKIVVGGTYDVPVGTTCAIKISDSTGVTIKTHVFTGKGVPTLEHFVHTIPASLYVDKIHIDYVYSPAQSSPTEQLITAGRFFLNIGYAPKIYESHDESVTLGLLSGYYTAGKVVVDKTAKANVSWLLTTTPYVKTHGAYPVGPGFVDRYGMRVSMPTALDDDLTITYSAHAVHRTPETVE